MKFLEVCCGWVELTEVDQGGFGSYRVVLKVSHLVKYKLMYIYLLVNEFTRHAFYVQRHIQAYPRNHFWHPKAVLILYPHCTTEVFVILHA